MKDKILYCILITFSSFFLTYSQEKFTLSGTISEKSNSETLIGVNIYFPDVNVGATTNEYGYFSITLPKGTHTMYVSYLGFATIQESITLTQSIRKDFTLEAEDNTLDEVVITSNTQKTNIRKAEMSVGKLSISTIKKCLLLWAK